MKKLIILLIPAMFGCIEEPTSAQATFNTSYGVSVFTVDSCEYVIYHGIQKGGIVHKQNCKFCKERINKN